jgi:iron complex transport system permease protein
VTAFDQAATARVGGRAELRLYGVLIALFIAMAVLSLMVGYVPIPVTDLVSALSGQGAGTAAVIVQEIRVPRMLLGALVGISLGLSGAALQGLLRNPLAEPGLVGASSSAAFGAALVFYFGLSAVFPLALPLAGMTGALLAVMLVHLLAGRDSSMTSLILAGVAISSFAGALTALALNLAPSPYAALEIVFWLLGSVADRSYAEIAVAAPLMAAGWALLLTTGRGLDALTLGEDTARSLGINLATMRFRLVLGVALAVGAAVSVSGAIGFVGLVVPHLLRPFVGHQPARLLGPSALGGAILVLASDICIRAVSPGFELKLGVVTALIGAPFFLALVLRTRRSLR